MFAVPMNEIVRIHASSGTTGKPTVVGYTRGDIEMWAMLIARGIRAAGGKPGDKMHIAYGYGLFTGGLGFHYGAEYLGCAVIPVSGGFTERQVQLICDFEPDIIAVTPSYLLAIADEFDRQGIDARKSSLRIALLGAEPWSEGMRAEIERRMGLDAINVYGLSEVIGPGVAQEYADTKDGLTLWEDHFFPEIIDPDTGKVLPDGEEGELVLTSLTKEAMPVIRYRTRDLTRLLPGNARAMRRIERIKGRSDDMLIIRGVNVFPSQIEAALAAEQMFAPHYILEVTRPDRLDELAVIVETRDVPAAGRDDGAGGPRRASHQGACRRDHDGAHGDAGHASSGRRAKPNASSTSGRGIKQRNKTMAVAEKRSWTVLDRAGLPREDVAAWLACDGAADRRFSARRREFLAAMADRRRADRPAAGKTCALASAGGRGRRDPGSATARRGKAFSVPMSRRSIAA